ncbi:unnamed protein product [Gadus morhua 'NCC']
MGPEERLCEVICPLHSPAQGQGGEHRSPALTWGWGCGGHGAGGGGGLTDSSQLEEGKCNAHVLHMTAIQTNRGGARALAGRCSDAPVDNNTWPRSLEGSGARKAGPAPGSSLRRWRLAGGARGAGLLVWRRGVARFNSPAGWALRRLQLLLIRAFHDPMCGNIAVRRLPAPGEDIIFGDVWSILPPSPPPPSPAAPPAPPAPLRLTVFPTASRAPGGPPSLYGAGSAWHYRTRGRGTAALL